MKQQQDQPSGEKAQRKWRRERRSRRRSGRGASRDRQGRGQLGDPEHDVVGVESVGVEGVPDPGHPDSDEQSDERAESGPGHIREEGGGELVDDQDIGEVEEQFESAGRRRPTGTQGGGRINGSRAVPALTRTPVITPCRATSDVRSRRLDTLDDWFAPHAASSLGRGLCPHRTSARRDAAEALVRYRFATVARPSAKSRS